MKNQVEFSFTEISSKIFPILEENIILGDSLLYVPIKRDLLLDPNFDLEDMINDIIQSDCKKGIKLKFLSKNYPKLLADNFRGFNIIIGNPPYISSKDLPVEYKELLRALYTTAVHQFDIYSIFIELSTAILSPDGFFAFIIPESYLGRSSFAESRRLLLKSTQILKIENIQNAFRKKSVSNIILYFRNRKNPERSFDFVHFKDKEDFTVNTGDLTSVPQNYCYELENFKILCHPVEIREIIQKMRGHTIPMSSSIKIHRGEEIGKKSDLIIEKSRSTTRKIISGENVKKFRIDAQATNIRFEDIVKKNAFYFQPKVVVRQLGNRIQAAYDAKGEFVTLQTVYNIISTNKSVSNEFLVGLLNSDLVQFYYEVIFREKQIFPRILLENILQIPLVEPGQKSRSKLKNIVEKIIESIQSEKKVPESITELNNLIYDLYKINKNEKKIIEKYLNS